jgi:hypothetical protein
VSSTWIPLGGMLSARSPQSLWKGDRVAEVFQIPGPAGTRRLDWAWAVYEEGACLAGGHDPAWGIIEAKNQAEQWLKARELGVAP